MSRRAMSAAPRAGPPDSGDDLPARLVVLGGLGRGARLDLDVVAVADPADLGVHQAGDAVLPGEDPEVAAGRPAGADDRPELFEDRRRQRATGIVDDRH